MLKSTGLLPPRPSIEDQSHFTIWRNFYNDILNKGSSLDLLIDFFEDRNKEKGETIQDYLYTGSCGGFKTRITKSDLYTHYFNFLYKSEDESDKDIWNIQNNMLRVLKRMKSEEPIYLLPREDIVITYKFINMLSRPPRQIY
jgi:hypothetical protein